MRDTRELLRPAVEGFEPMPDAFERVLDRRDRKQRNRRIAAGILGIAIFALAALGLARLISSEPTPAVPEPTQPKNGDAILFTAGTLDPDPRTNVSARGEGYQLYVGRPGGAAEPFLPVREGTTRGCPSFSADGSLLAFTEKWDPGTGVRNALVIQGVSPTGEMRGEQVRIPVTMENPDYGLPCPSWARAGRHLAVALPGHGVLFAQADGSSNLVPLRTRGEEDNISQLAWSPDGSEVAVLIETNESRSVVSVVPADGGASRQLAVFEPEEGSAIAWTADGRSVVAGGASGPCCSDVRPFVRVLDATTGASTDVPLPKTWNGSGILQMISAEDDRFVVMRWQAAGEPWAKPEWLDLDGNVTPIPLKYQPGSFMSLSPDGKQLLYVAYSEPMSKESKSGCMGQFLIAAPLDGGEPTRYSPCTNGFGDNNSVFSWQPRPA